MTKHISIHKAEFHNSFYINSEENEDLIDDILSVEKFIYPLEDKNHYYFYDVENKKLISKSLDPKSFNLDKNTEIVSLTGLSPDIVSKMHIPKKVDTFIFEGADLMPLQLGKTKNGDALWKTVINYINLYKLVETVEERIVIEKKLREICNNKISLHIEDFGLTKLFQKIENSNITQLTIGWAYLSDFDFQILSKLKGLETLSILYCYNDNIKWLPKKLTSLKIYGTTIQNLSEINISLPNLIELDLEGNAINTLDNLELLPTTIENLSLGLNLIKDFNIDELPENLEYLDLPQNLIDNNFFRQNKTHKKLKYLNLNSNKLVITSSILHLIIETFPNLEYLELLNNKTDGVPVEFLGDYDNQNCLESVEFYLEGIEFVPNGEELSLSKLKNQKEFIEGNWHEPTLPLKVILADFQYNFSKHFLKMPFFSQHVNGIYCFIEHDNCELLMLFEEETKEITFRVQSDRSETVALYFHKYFQDVKALIAFNSHMHILPAIHTSKSCEFLRVFCNKVYKVDYQVKSDVILKKEGKGIKTLINNRSIEGVNDEGKFAGDKYEFIEDVAFVLVSGKSAYPFIIREGVLTNALKLNKDYYYYLILRTALDKENYINAITSKFLNSSSLLEVDVFIDNNIKKKVSCFVNPNYFQVQDNTLSAVSLKFPELVEDYLKEIKMDNGKYCEFSIDDGFVELKYVD
ncbi:leucine-rich repeat domain-containing protein [Formosa algae]|uniref:hypothetical protein n=1 Tax=Formosa algae TaxID=225843 RepID=UPI000CCE8C5B|nr:hypothetical protein [Formosa algae]PNW26938.1 hypothetical protein BKP44_15170 [Formosa algae]